MSACLWKPHREAPQPLSRRLAGGRASGRPGSSAAHQLTGCCTHVHAQRNQQLQQPRICGVVLCPHARNPALQSEHCALDTRCVATVWPDGAGSYCVCAADMWQAVPDMWQSPCRMHDAACRMQKVHAECRMQEHPICARVVGGVCRSMGASGQGNQDDKANEHITSPRMCA